MRKIKRMLSRSERNKGTINQTSSGIRATTVYEYDSNRKDSNELDDELTLVINKRLFEYLGSKSGISHFGDKLNSAVHSVAKNLTDLVDSLAKTLHDEKKKEVIIDIDISRADPRIKMDKIIKSIDNLEKEFDLTRNSENKEYKIKRRQLLWLESLRQTHLFLLMNKIIPKMNTDMEKIENFLGGLIDCVTADINRGVKGNYKKKLEKMSGGDALNRENATKFLNQLTEFNNEFTKLAMRIAQVLMGLVKGLDFNYAKSVTNDPAWTRKKYDDIVVDSEEV